MFTPTLPFLRWPLWQHLAVAALVLAGVGGAAWWGAQHARAAHFGQLAELDTTQRLLQGLQASRAALPKGNFSQQLPPASTADDVARDIARFAESGRVRIQSLSVQPQTATPRELGRVQFNISATAEYSALKAWLAELLGRYPSLAVLTLSMRSAPNDGARLSSGVSLVLWVKD
ncbi:GspMb/PilO family protein [Rhodoferax sp.]|uniref:GspMb/PilO family protein n=1 Tax=Rhodoferax sp. TaxID=50421 RepID=UPI00277ABC52|nr:GspMb/PilO family protein [Rhodoferax sp.]